jgi:nitrous oxidase accessory protein
MFALRLVAAFWCTLTGATAIARPLDIQQLIAHARPGSTVVVPPGTYSGDILIDRAVHLIGHGHPKLIGSGKGTVIGIRADDVVVDGFDIDGLGGGDLGQDPSGIHIAAHRVTVRNCRITNTLFGIYLREADGTSVENCMVRGIPGKEPGEKGSGIHVWNTDGFRIIGNDIREARDGIYIQSSPHGVVQRNVVRDLRYGLHYMYSDDNLFEDNRFENAAAGTVVMYSRRIVFRRNSFVHNRGFASVGLLLKACDDILAEDNLIADNARGVFLEGSRGNVLRRNIIASSDTAIVLYDSCETVRFEGNSFVGNLTPLTLVGHRTDTVFAGNYFSDNREPDLDGDGRSDRPYRLSSVFDHLRDNLNAADLFSQSLAAAALATAEELFPVLDPVAVEDHSALVRPPRLASVPLPHPSTRKGSRTGLALAMFGIAGGSSVLLAGRRRGAR